MPGVARHNVSSADGFEAHVGNEDACILQYSKLAAL